MTGCVFKRKLHSGAVTWAYSVDVGRGADGGRIRQFKSGFARKSEAESALRILLAEKDHSADIGQADPQTFAAFTQTWFTEYGVRKCSPKTLERYRQLAGYVTPHLGGVKLQDLTALTLERVLLRLRDSGGRDRLTKKERPLSPMTVHHIAAVLNVILRKAVKLKLLKANPMEGVELPSVPRREARVLDPEKVTWYLDVARSHGLYELLMFAAGTGCRRGEMLAITWQDVDLMNGAARISKSLEQTAAGFRVKSTKTERTRTLSLPRSLCELLRFHREAQEQNRRMFGPDYRTDLDLVFCGPDGEYLNPNNVSSKACVIARQAGLGKGVSMHTLRHSHASQLLAAGVALPTVSKRLGHTDVHTTATIYSHSLPKDDLTAAELWDASFQKSAARAAKGKSP